VLAQTGLQRAPELRSQYDDGIGQASTGGVEVLAEGGGQGEADVAKPMDAYAGVVQPGSVQAGGGRPPVGNHRSRADWQEQAWSPVAITHSRGSGSMAGGRTADDQDFNPVNEGGRFVDIGAWGAVPSRARNLSCE